MRSKWHFLRRLFLSFSQALCISLSQTLTHSSWAHNQRKPSSGSYAAIKQKRAYGVPCMKTHFSGCKALLKCCLIFVFQQVIIVQSVHSIFFRKYLTSVCNRNGIGIFNCTNACFKCKIPAGLKLGLWVSILSQLAFLHNTKWDLKLQKWPKKAPWKYSLIYQVILSRWNWNNWI